MQTIAMASIADREDRRKVATNVRAFQGPERALRVHGKALRSRHVLLPLIVIANVQVPRVRVRAVFQPPLVPKRR
jgi:hypothetical protein